MCKAKELSSNLLENISVIKETHQELSKQLSYTDKIITDLQHEIELGRFDVVRGYKKLKQLQDTLIERRKIKNEHELIQPLIAYINSIETKINELHETITYREERIVDRKYRPRVLKDNNKQIK